MQNSGKPRLIRTFLVDGTLEGIRVIDCETTINAFIVPRLKLAEAKEHKELFRPALYFLVNSEGNQAYIGEAESFYKRVKDHDQNKDWWDMAIAIVSTTEDGLNKADVKYLESMAVERAQNGSVRVENKVSPVRNSISRFDVHRLENILEDAQLVLTSLNYDILSVKQSADKDDLWYLNYKGTTAKGEYRGTQFVLLAGSTVHIGATERWIDNFPKIHAMREETLQTKAAVSGEVATINENIAFRSVSLAAGFVTGRHSNGWKEWKNPAGKTMDEIIRKAVSNK